MIRSLYNNFIIIIKKSSTARKVLIILCVKLFVIFIVLKIFFFPNFLKSKFDNQKDRSNYVLEHLTKSK